MRERVTHFELEQWFCLRQRTSSPLDEIFVASPSDDGVVLSLVYEAERRSEVEKMSVFGSLNFSADLASLKPDFG